MINRIAIAACLALPFSITSPAAAHPGHAGIGDLASGFIHPLSGPDHLLAILACGALAAVQAGRATWLIPTLFVGAMLAGGVLGTLGVWTNHAEYALALSVPVLCLLLVPRWRTGFPLAAAVTMTAGLLHGAAHGAELPAGSDATGYFAGFLISTALLLGIGIVLFHAGSSLVATTSRAVGRERTTTRT